MTIFDKFRIDKKVAIITGGAGLLGGKHAEVIADGGGVPILWDVNKQEVKDRAQKISQTYDTQCLGMHVDITNLEAVKDGLAAVLEKTSRLDILINNAARNPKMTDEMNLTSNRFEKFSVDAWQDDMAVGLTGAFLCSQVLGTHMAENQGGIILNIASDLGVIAPDQRIYRKEGLKAHEQDVKPVSYSVIKHGIIGLTKYLATYWADKNVRVNSISPGGVYTDQSDDFVEKLSTLIPLGRMANQDEYKSAILFLISEASSYMTGSNLVIDGGRTCW